MSRTAKKEVYKFWQDTIEQYENSGLKREEFCRRNNLNFHKFRNWRFRIKKEQDVRDKKASLDNKFIPLIVNDLSVKKDLTPIHTIELKLDSSGNIHVCIPSQFNPESLSSLLTILRRAKC